MGYTSFMEPYRHCLLYLYLSKYDHNMELYDFLVKHEFPETRARYINKSIELLGDYVINGKGLHDVIEIRVEDPNEVIKKFLKNEKCNLSEYTKRKIIKNQPYEIEELNGLILNAITCEDLITYFDKDFRFHVVKKEENKKVKKKETSIGRDLLDYFNK